MKYIEGRNLAQIRAGSPASLTAAKIGFVEGFGEAMQLNLGTTEAARQESPRAEVRVK